MAGREFFISDFVDPEELAKILGRLSPGARLQAMFSYDENGKPVVSLTGIGKVVGGMKVIVELNVIDDSVFEQMDEATNANNDNGTAEK